MRIVIAEVRKLRIINPGTALAFVAKLDFASNVIEIHRVLDVEASINIFAILRTVKLKTIVDIFAVKQQIAMGVQIAFALHEFVHGTICNHIFVFSEQPLSHGIRSEINFFHLFQIFFARKFLISEHIILIAQIRRHEAVARTVDVITVTAVGRTVEQEA